MTSCSSTYIFWLGILICLPTSECFGHEGASTPDVLPLCSEECTVSGSPKLSYGTGKTYVYSYHGNSTIHLQDINGGFTETSWGMEVRLSWISPCDVVITIRNSNFDGKTGIPEASFLERYPLLVAINDGHVQHVCGHEDDDTWSLNFKKGIASALQNSLQSLSPVNSGLSFTETDVVGDCPTEYKVEHRGHWVIVTKEKTHRLCQNHFLTQSENPVAWLKAPLPIEESRTICDQKINLGIYTAITCADKKTLRLSYGSYKYIEAEYTSELIFNEEHVTQPSEIPALTDKMLLKSLLYDRETLKKNPSSEANLDEIMINICDTTVESMQHDTAKLLSKAISIMREVPDGVIPMTLTKIREGHYCTDFHKLESLYLDAVAFVYDAGAVKVMVEELVKPGITKSRNALYSAAMHLFPRPNIEVIAALKNVFIRSEFLKHTSLAAASVVNRYCQLYGGCENQLPVLGILQLLGDKIERDCAYTSDDTAQNSALTNLKTLGNMGVINEHYSRVLIRCLERVEADISVRIAAAEAFRNVKCQKEATSQLTSIAVDSNINTEVRIASYLQAIRCADEDDLAVIIEKISKETSTQVRGFILTHLNNVQKSNFKKYDTLKELLTDTVIPTNFTVDSRKYSRHLDLAYYSQAMDAGIGMESNVVYDTASYFPRSVGVNLTAAIGGALLNIGEFGIRVKGLEPVLEDFFGPGGYYRTSSFKKMLHDISVFGHEKSKKIVDGVNDAMRQRRSIDYSAILLFLEKLYGGPKTNVPQLYIFARMMGQELFYSSVKKKPCDNAIDNLIESFLRHFREIVTDMKNLNLDTANTAQIELDYELPTIQGVPLRLRLEGTAVIGLKFSSNLDISQITAHMRDSEAMLKISPSISARLNIFVGHDGYISTDGVMLESSIYNSEGISFDFRSARKGDFSIGFDFSNSNDLMKIESEIYLMKTLKSSPVQKIIPSSLKDIRVHFTSCSRHLEDILGIKVCYALNFPNIFLSQGLPLGQKSVMNLSFEKTDPSMKGYNMKVNIRRTREQKISLMKISVSKISSTSGPTCSIEYKKGTSHELTAAFQSQSFSSGVWMKLVSAGRKQSLEMVTKYNVGKTLSTFWIKFDTLTSMTSLSKETVIRVYASPHKDSSSNTLVGEWKLSSKVNHRTHNVDVTSKTSNALKNNIDLNFESSFDWTFWPYESIPFEMVLKKFELHLSTKDWVMASYIRKPKELTHVSSFEVLHNSSNVMSLHAVHMFKGRLDELFTFQNILTATVQHSTYKISADIFNEMIRTGIDVIVLQPTDKEKIFQTDIHFGRIEEASDLNILVDIPHYVEPVQFISKFVNTKGSRLLIQSTLTHGKHMLFDISGPVLFSASLSALSFEGNLRIITLTMGPYNVSMAVTFSQITQLVSFDVRDWHSRVISVKWTVDAEYSKETVYGLELYVPTFIGNELYVIISESHISAMLDALAFPQLPNSRHLKGLADLNIANKTLRSDFSWDVDRSPNKKLSMDLALVTSPSDSGHSTINGDISIMNKRYNCKLVTIIDGDDDSESVERSFDFTFRLPSRKTLNTQMGFKLEQLISSVKLETHFFLNTLTKKKYDATLIFRFQNHHKPDVLKISSEMRYTPPSGHQSRFRAEAVHNTGMYGTERIVILKAIASTYALQNPLIVEMRLQNEAHSSKMDFTTETDKKNSLLTWDLQMYPRNIIRNINVVMKLDPLYELLKTIRMMAEHGNTAASGAYLEELVRSHDPLEYNWIYNRTSSDARAFFFHSRTRSLGCEITISPTEHTLKIYPDKERSHAMYQLSSTYQPSWNESHSLWQGVISHPAFTRDIQGTVYYMKEGENICGTFEFDIYPDIADRIHGKITSTHTALNSYQYEATLTTRIMIEPIRIVVAASATPNMIDVDIRSKLTSLSNVVAFKYQQTSGQDSAFSFLINKNTSAIVDVSGSIKHIENGKCNGIVVDSIADFFIRPRITGKYDFQAEFCQKTYMRFSTKASGKSKDIYSLLLGLQEPNNFEIGLLQSKDSLDLQPLILYQSTLSNPLSISFNFINHYQEAMNVTKGAVEIGKSVMIAFNEYCNWIYEYLQNEAQTKSIVFPSPKVVILYREIEQELRKIYNDLIRDGLIPKYNWLLHILRSPKVTAQKKLLIWMWSQFIRLHESLENYLLPEMIEWENEFKEVTNVILAGMSDAKHFIEDGEEPKSFQHIERILDKTYLIQALKKEIQSLSVKYPQEFHGFQQMISKSKVVALRDISKLRKQFLQMPSTQNFIKWMDDNYGHFTEWAAKRLVNDIVQKLTYISAESRKSEFHINVPLWTPAYSLSQAMQKTSLVGLLRDAGLSYYDSVPTYLSELLWIYYNYIPNKLSDLLPPFNRTAMIVGGTELLTFDNDILQVPRAECQILLASYLLNELIMEFPEEGEPPQFTLTVSATTVIIKPDHSITINGKPVMDDHMDEDPISVSKTHLEIKIIAPFLTLRVSRVSQMASLEISGWAFGRVAGLLGTYDGEVGNDWMMPSGARAANMQQLVSSWQENQQCETPNIVSFNPSFARVVRCSAMLGVRSRCSPVVNPDLFIQMCYAGQDACDAARAYRTLCSEKGVLPLVPMGC